MESTTVSLRLYPHRLSENRESRLSANNDISPPKRTNTLEDLTQSKELSKSSKAPNMDGRPVILLAVENLTDLRMGRIDLFDLGDCFRSCGIRETPFNWEGSIGAFRSLGRHSSLDGAGKGGKIEVRMLLTCFSNSWSISVSGSKRSKSSPRPIEFRSPLTGLGL